ncbi:MAG: hypothetical protein K2Y37_03430 [Pirellulales bacterium]|nr:hypothetical protein [Pirellulales bacterium]
MSLATGHPSGAIAAGRRAAQTRSWPTYLPDLAVSLLLIAVTATIYAPVADHEFTYYDDPAYVTHNDHVNTGLTRENIAWAWVASHAANWHPLTWMSHMVDIELFGLNPRGHHLVNVALHAVNAVLLFLAWRMLLAASLARSASGNAAAESPQPIWLPATGPATTFWLPAFIAGVFAWHPLHVQSVAWVAERKDMLSGVCFMLTLIGYAWYVRAPSWRRYLLVAMPLAVGLLCKPTLVTLPLVLWLLDYWPLGRWQLPSAGRASLWRGAARCLVEKLPLLAIVVAASIATIVAQQGGNSIQRLTVLPWGPRFANAAIGYWAYIRLTFWPSGLAVFYPHPHYIEQLTWEDVAIGAFVLSTVSLVVTWLWRRQPWLPVGWLWFAGMLVPMIGILQVGDQAYADRYMYLTQTGLVLIVAASAVLLVSRLPGGRWIAATLAIAASAACLWRTSVELTYWRNHELLFRHALQVTERNYLAGVSLGHEMIRQNRIEEAIACFDQARRDGPRYFDARRNLAMALGARGTERLSAGDRVGGLADLRRMIECAPTGKLRMPAHEAWVKFGNNLAWYLATDPAAVPLSPDEALQIATRACAAFELAPAEYLDTLAAAYAASGQYSKAVETVVHAIAAAEHEAALPQTEPDRQASLRALVATLQSRLPLYWSLKPYREAWPTAPPAAAADAPSEPVSQPAAPAANSAQ